MPSPTSDTRDRADGNIDSPPVAIVTGGSRGIGLATTDALLKRGWSVWICGRDQRRLTAVMIELEVRYAGRIFARPLDVTEPESVETFVAEVAGRQGRIDLLVNNAGMGLFAPVDEIEIEDWQRLMRTNLDAPFFFTRHVAPVMREQGRGFIINVGSLASLNSIAGGAAYNASKFGILGFSDACMLDLREAGIRVCSVLPGSVDTHFFDPIRGDSPGSDGRSHMLQPADVAQAIVDLLDYPERALPSRIELRPTHTGKSK